MKKISILIGAWSSVLAVFAQSSHPLLIPARQLNAQSDQLDRLNKGDILYWQNDRMLGEKPASGNYSIVCPDKTIHTVDDHAACGPVKLHLRVQVQHAPDCQASEGSIAVTPSLGSAPYQFLWSTGAVDDHIDRLTPGKYSCTITDRFGNKEELKDVEIRALNRAPCDASDARKRSPELGFYVYPNPSQGRLSVVMEAPFVSYRITDQSGKTILQDQVAEESGQALDIRLDQLQAGSYFIIMTDGAGAVQSQRFVVIK